MWVPSVYTSPGMYLVNHPVNLGLSVSKSRLTSSCHAPFFFLALTLTLKMAQLALSILAAGILCIYINYDCDWQRQHFRKTNGKCSIWGRTPSKVKKRALVNGRPVFDLTGFLTTTHPPVADRGLLSHHHG